MFDRLMDVLLEDRYIFRLEWKNDQASYRFLLRYVVTIVQGEGSPAFFIEDPELPLGQGETNGTTRFHGEVRAR